MRIVIKNIYKNTVIVMLLIHMGGCTTMHQFNNLINKNKLIKKIDYNQYFRIVTLRNSLFYSVKKSTLYVFIEGDGLPWKTHTQISSNPDPINPLALSLMTKTPYPSVYLSRPCYWERNSYCSYEWWTNKRYSKQVVDSMIETLNKIAKDYENITLVGYSGGGALAALIAISAKKVNKLITLSGNLDHKKWTEHHNFSPLTESLNSINYILPTTLSQFHFAAENDKNILPIWVKEFSNKQTNGQYFLMKNSDHKCCWVKQWDKILEITKY